MRHALTALLLLTSPAAAGEVVLSAEAGMSFVSDSRISSVGPLHRNELATTLAKGVSVGYQTRLGGGRIRGLLGYDYVNVDGDWGVTHNGTTARQTLDIQSSSFVLGLEYDFKQVEIGALYPFVGLGVRLVGNRPASATLIEFTDHESGCLADDPDTWGLGYHALAGLGVDFDHVTIRVFYQYTDRGSVEVGGDGCPNWHGKQLTYTADIRIHGVLVGGSYRF